MDEILADLGLTFLEIKIYKFLLFEGPNQAGKVSRMTGIHRRNVYDALERLIQKGLVSYIKENNKRQYEANDPAVVMDKLKAKQSEWERIMPDIRSHMDQWGEAKETLFFRGVNGIKHIFLDQIQARKEVLVFATGTDVTKVVKFFLPKYQLLRQENKISTRMIFDEDAKKYHLSTIKMLPLCRHKFLKNFNSSNMSQYVYGDNVAMVVWGDNPFAILIRHKDIAEGFRERFELLWNF